jgi:putative long chain acyl-CoA synthase
LSLVAAINRLGAVAVLISPATPDEILPRALELGETDALVTDPETAARARAAIGGKVLVLGGVGEVPGGSAAGAARVLPDGVIDMEKIDSDAVALPTWYKPDAGLARDLAMVFVFAGRLGDPADAPRAMRITNRRWAFAALGAAAAATLTTRDTVYCALPLHHPSGTLVATGSAIVGGARLALASTFTPHTFWEEVRRYGATIVFYAGDMCRALVDAPAALGENNNPVRLFAGSGLRADVWRRLVDRFGPVGVLEMYASTEANVVLANAAGKKIGSVGKPLPGSPEVAIAAYDFAADELVRDGAGRLLRARLDEPGMLVARMSARAGADIAHIDPRRLLRDAFGPDSPASAGSLRSRPGDTWFVTGDFFRVDAVGDYWFVDRSGQMVMTRMGAIASTRIEDALYEAGGIAMCVAAGRAEDAIDHAPTAEAPATRRGVELPIAAIVLAPNAPLDLGALSAAVRTLPEYARPRRLRVVPSLPMTDGYRPIKSALRSLDLSRAAGNVYAWDTRLQKYAAL